MARHRIDAEAVLIAFPPSGRLEGGTGGRADSEAPRPGSGPPVMQPPRLGLVALGVLLWLVALQVVDWSATLVAWALDLAPP